MSNNMLAMHVRDSDRQASRTGLLGLLSRFCACASAAMLLVGVDVAD
jgi:hypothetical protein